MANLEKVLTTAARMAFSAALHGDFRGFERAVADLETSEAPAHRVWRLALETLRWSFDPVAARRPDLDHVGRFVGAAPEVRAVAARACTLVERVAIASLDREGLAAWIGLHAELLGAEGSLEDAGGNGGEDGRDGGDGGDGGNLALASARLWHRLLTGAGTVGARDEEAKSLLEEAARQSAGAEVIEAAVARALLALSRDAIDDAIELARYASRMAQAEAQPSCEYLANLTLARVRRYSGRPHLALHILAALGRAAPSLWAGWIGWETLLAGGDPVALEPGYPGPSTTARNDLSELIQTARAGDRAAFGVAASALRKSAAIWPALARETEALLSAVDPAAETSETTGDWIRGETATIPCGLHGVGIPRGVGAQAGAALEGATAFVLARPGAPGRRFLRPGLALAGPARLLARESVKSSTAGVRTETGVAALALAGGATLPRQEFFRRVYGFPFVAQRHQAVLDVLCHRMRQLLGGAGDVRRHSAEEGAGAGAGAGAVAAAASGPSLALDLREAIVVPDMRCALPAADRVLRALATLGAISASAAADALRMPLRTVQAVLQQLVAEGACSIEREGRRVAYRVEDTTFTEVTAL